VNTQTGPTRRLRRTPASPAGPRTTTVTSLLPGDPSSAPNRRTWVPVNAVVIAIRWSDRSATNPSARAAPARPRPNAATASKR
jgi:hypothetical protein